MKAAYVEFMLESSTMNMAAFHGAYARTHTFFTKESVSTAISYGEILQRDRAEQYQPLEFPFACTPAESVDFRASEVLYRAGDDPNKGLLKFGRQELILPGSRFHFAIWGYIPALEVGQVFLIGKKRAPAVITKYVVEDDAKADWNSTAPIVLPIQVELSDISKLPSYRPIAFTSRYFIVSVPLMSGTKRMKIGNCIVPLLD